MQSIQSAVPAASSNSIEVNMAKALKIARVKIPARDDSVVLKRIGKPDLQFDGHLLLTVETERLGRRFDGGERWHVYRLFLTKAATRLIVAAEGHSTVEGETVRYEVHVCENGADAWARMGCLEELKPELAELNWPAVEVLDDY